MSINKKQAIFLMGPTAVGKTKLSLAVAKNLPIEIISVDSAMVYNKLDIGTGKPTACELKAVPHHLINIREPEQPYSAADFCQDAVAAMEKIWAKGKLPVLVGGTMLYFKALHQGLSELPSCNPAIRAKIAAEATSLGWRELHKKLMQVDSTTAKRLHPNDQQRIQRALEVFELTGIPLSEYHQKRNSHLSGWDVKVLALAPGSKEELHQRIAIRFELMLQQGLVYEVTGLRQDKALSLDLPAIRSVGYRQVWQYLDGCYSYAEMIAKAVTATRQLAKRQLTWLKSWLGLRWIHGVDDLKSNLKNLKLKT